METFKFIEIDETSRMPKYKQIVDSVIYNVSIGRLRMDQKIPSINMLSEGFNLSRDTVEKAYNILKERNVIAPIAGKGYYVSRTKLISKINVLFLINKLSSYKMSVFNSFVNSIGGNSHVDLHIYHFDETLFLNALDKDKFAYDKYVIMPHFKTGDCKHASITDKVLEGIKNIPKEKLIILDEKNSLLEDGIVEVYQDFENDIYNALKAGLSKIATYDKLILIYPEKAVCPYPRRILHGFKKFCVEHAIDFEILDEICDDIVLIKGDLFITIEESDLVSLIKQIRDYEFQLGKDVGVISYNDTPLKELLGITVISTDFKMMGETAARMILNKETGKVKNPFNFIDRGSI
jgi:DNA-binding transcriptional regulator YhcF (GntR family)